MIADIVVAVLAIILLLITMIVATIVLNNFGRGLKKQSEQSLVFDCIKLGRLMFLFATVAKNMPEHQRGKSVSDYRGPMSGHPYRMSIDWHHACQFLLKTADFVSMPCITSSPSYRLCTTATTSRQPCTTILTPMDIDSICLAPPRLLTGRSCISIAICSPLPPTYTKPLFCPKFFLLFAWLYLSAPVARLQTERHHFFWQLWSSHWYFFGQLRYST